MRSASNSPLPEPGSPVDRHAPRRTRFHLPTRPARRIAFVGCYVGFCLTLIWSAAKFYWYLAAAVPPTESPTVWDHYFPNMRISGLSSRPAARTDGEFDLLMLGGSVLEPTWGTIEADLRGRLEKLAPGRVRICNLACAGFTSRDSLLQYEHLKDCRFDLVLIYDGINDVRMNCCPPEKYREDYTHFARYSGMQKRLAAGTISLPASALDRWWTVAGALPYGTTHPELLDFAADPRTPQTLRANLERIWTLSRERGDPLLMLTYAWYIPEDYSAEKFHAGLLDYSPGSNQVCELEMWGRKEHVPRILTLQNDALRGLARSDSRLRFVDLAGLIPPRRENFVDPCHLTAAGCRRFVDNIWPEVERALRESPAGK